jgi:tetratricopeptide (TPR) repeat protein
MGDEKVEIARPIDDIMITLDLYEDVVRAFPSEFAEGRLAQCWPNIKFDICGGSLYISGNSRLRDTALALILGPQGKRLVEKPMRRWGAVRVLTLALAGLLGAVTPLASQTRDENWKRCSDSDPDLRIGGCTAVIQSGQETNENLSIAFLKRGIAYDGKGNSDRAIEDYGQAIRLNPSYVDAFYDRGNAYKNKSNQDRAIQDYGEAIRLNPSYANAFNNRGISYGMKANYERAILDFDEAIRLNPSNANAFKRRDAFDFISVSSPLLSRTLQKHWS